MDSNKICTGMAGRVILAEGEGSHEKIDFFISVFRCGSRLFNGG